MTNQSRLPENRFPLKAGAVGGGVLCVWVGYLASAHRDTCFSFATMLVCLLLAGAALGWLRKVETRRFYRHMVFLVVATLATLPSVAGAQQTEAGISTALGSGLGLIMLIAMPTGVVMIIRGIMMDRHDGAWKWEILKGLVLAAAPMIINVIFGFFLGSTSGGNFTPISPTFNN